MQSNTQTILKKLRAAGYSQSQLSRLTGIPQPRLSRWESGDVPVSVDDGIVLANLLAKQSRVKKVGA